MNTTVVAASHVDTKLRWLQQKKVKEKFAFSFLFWVTSRKDLSTISLDKTFSCLRNGRFDYVIHKRAAKARTP